MRQPFRGLIASLLLMVPLAGSAAVFISVSVGPPPLPVYVAPPMPEPGYFWTPGYWAYADGGYYWVPGTWVMAPAPGLLWTPGYWGWSDGAYLWHGGYWGPHVGFYGGINYGFGYGGAGFHGGYWNGGRYVADTTVINNTTINNTTINRVSYNGGTGGVAATPTPAEQRAAQEQHVAMSQTQQQHEQAAARDTTMRASYNHGNPSVAATAKPGVFYGKGVVASHFVAPSGAGPRAEHTAMSQPAGHPGGAAPAVHSHVAPVGTPHGSAGGAPHGAPGGAPHGAPHGAPGGVPGGAPHAAPAGISHPPARGAEHAPGGEHAPPHAEHGHPG